MPLLRDHELSLLARRLLGVLLVLFVVLAGTACAREVRERKATGSGSEDLRHHQGTLKFTVTEGGVTKTATMRCGSPNRVDGYLGDDSSGSCPTALMSEPVVDYLERGTLPKGRACRHGRGAPPGAVFTAEGKWVNQEVRRRLVVNDDCTASLWNFLLPLRTPQPEPLILNRRALE